MLSALEQFYLDLEEPNKSIMLALRQIITAYDDAISEHWKYRLPFFCFKGKMFCYLWRNKKTKEPYIGIWKGKSIDFPELIAGRTKTNENFTDTDR